MDRGPRRVSPFFLPASLANLATGQISIKYGFKGPNLANVTACAASTHSLGDSFRIIQRGEADIMVAGGAEYPITDLGIAGFAVMKALSSRNDEPEKASRPFDKTRDGFVAAEGSSILILEDLEHAMKRGAKIYAEIVGYGFTSDAFHSTAPDPEADGATRSMANAVRDAGVDPTSITCINAHGTSTPLNDKIETQAIKQVFGDHAYQMAISSTQVHDRSYAGSHRCYRSYFQYPYHYRFPLFPLPLISEFPDEECDLNYTPNVGVEKDIPYIMSNSFGFGGTKRVDCF